MWSLLVVLLSLAWTDARQQPGCSRAEELQEDQMPLRFRSWASWWKRHHSLQLVPFLENEQTGQQRLRRHHSHGCPNLKLQDIQNGEVHERSISPWEYHIDKDEDRYPPKLAFAKCLCKGCIDAKMGRETTSLNSVEVLQNMMVLRRKACTHNGMDGFFFEEEYINVPVACTCVVPRYSS